MIPVQVVGSSILEEDQVEVIGLAEDATGEGRSLLVQVPLDNDEEGFGYCLSTETGASHYGGLEGMQIDRHRHRITIILAPEASKALGLAEEVSYDLHVPVSDELSLYGVLESMALHKKLPIRFLS